MSLFGELKNEYSIAEWVSLGISLSILAVIVGLVVWFWLSPADRLARFLVREGQTRMEDGLYYVDFTIENIGDETGEKVEVKGSITAGDHKEEASTVFDFVPGRSEEKGVLIFTRPPRGLVITVKSYQKP
ncbi:MAG: hypothetical protein BWZ01_00836 [Deltaproteobacteria bacterium ADurb.BinA179]|nr:TIGR02588 family protein [Deltaproteobacteria bacterium]MDI9542278.1 TIGR02588 family protein [Pseudomonadota bacterium]NLW67735.1 TIGR02588 family protein [Bacteriovoracaceae bacterium]OPZ29088.1 MAG: hypothetical protein BWZ01_00836 [Deltaproteobacteria bacterium ADurb.BinA179]HRR21345.1 TIGR02588 family protein [Desulfomonilia bacterium]